MNKDEIMQEIHHLSKEDIEELADFCSELSEIMKNENSE